MTGVVATPTFASQGHLLAVPTITHTISDIPARDASVEVDFTTSPHGVQYSYAAGTTTYSPSGAFKTTPNVSTAFTAVVAAPTGRSIIEYRWDFGDGSVAYGQVTSHTYKDANEHTQAVLRVTDSFGNRWYRRKSMYVL